MRYSYPAIASLLFSPFTTAKLLQAVQFKSTTLISNKHLLAARHEAPFTAQECAALAHDDNATAFECGRAGPVYVCYSASIKDESSIQPTLWAAVGICAGPSCTASKDFSMHYHLEPTDQDVEMHEPEGWINIQTPTAEDCIAHVAAFNSRTHSTASKMMFWTATANGGGLCRAQIEISLVRDTYVWQKTGLVRLDDEAEFSVSCEDARWKYPGIRAACSEFIYPCH